MSVFPSFLQPQPPPSLSIIHCGQILIFHQSRFAWNKGIALPKNTPFRGPRLVWFGRELYVIWPRKSTEETRPFFRQLQLEVRSLKHFTKGASRRVDQVFLKIPGGPTKRKNHHAKTRNPHILRLKKTGGRRGNSLTNKKHKILKDSPGCFFVYKFLMFMTACWCFVSDSTLKLYSKPESFWI